jgi:outer membrane protein
VVWLRADVAEASRIQAERALEVTQQAVSGEAVAAYYALQRAKFERERAIEVLLTAGATREAQNDRYRVGVGSLLELLDAESLEQDARQRRIEAERDEAIASARLLASCGLMVP